MNPSIRADFELDLGEKNCSQLIMEIMLAMRQMELGQTLLITAKDPSAPLDLVAWCHMTSNTLLRRLPDSSGIQFLLMKG